MLTDVLGCAIAKMAVDTLASRLGISSIVSLGRVVGYFGQSEQCAVAAHSTWVCLAAPLDLIYASGHDLGFLTIRALMRPVALRQAATLSSETRNRVMDWPEWIMRGRDGFTGGLACPASPGEVDRCFAKWSQAQASVKAWGRELIKVRPVVDFDHIGRGSVLLVSASRTETVECRFDGLAAIDSLAELMEGFGSGYIKELKRTASSG